MTKRPGAYRVCIKCGKTLPIGWFDDNWRHKSNICKDCKYYYSRNLKYPQSNSKIAQN